MFGGKEQDGHGTAPTTGPTGHMDEWEALAVDYLDGRLDPQAKTAVESHLQGCPACDARLQLQQGAITFLQTTPLEDAPAELEGKVLDEILRSSASEAVTVYRQDTQPSRLETSRWSWTWRRRIKPWVPAAVAVAAVFVALVSYGVFQSTTGDSADTEATAGMAVASQEAAPEADETARSAEKNSDASTTAVPATTAVPSTTTAGADLGMAYPVGTDGASMDTAAGMETTTTTVAATETTAVATITTAGALTTTTVGGSSAYGPSRGEAFTTTQDRTAMIAGLQDAEAPVYLVFEGAMASDDGYTKTAGDAAEQITNLTGLEPLNSSLALDRATFAAYLPKNNAVQLVDLLRSIGATLGLAVGLTMELPAEATRFVAEIMDHKGEFVELSAYRTPQPAVSTWSFTTSTLVPPDGSAGAGSQNALDETGTYVLVVIFVGN
jgi:anti-sigma factor RsiW